MSGLIYLEPRDNPEYFFRQLIHDINTNFSAGTSGVGSPIQNGLNTYTGGTVSAQTINVSALTIDNIYVSGNSIFNSISATTYLNLPIDVYVTGGTYSAGSTTFRNNTGGTFTVTGYFTGDTINTQNWITSTGSTIEFGGNLIHNTTADTGNYNFYINRQNGTPAFGINASPNNVTDIPLAYFNGKLVTGGLIAGEQTNHNVFIGDSTNANSVAQSGLLIKYGQLIVGVPNVQTERGRLYIDSNGANLSYNWNGLAKDYGPSPYSILTQNANGLTYSYSGNTFFTINNQNRIGVGMTPATDSTLIIQGKSANTGNYAISVNSLVLGNIFQVDDYQPRVNIGASYTTNPATINLGDNSFTQRYINFGNNGSRGTVYGNDGLRWELNNTTTSNIDVFLNSDNSLLSYQNSYVSASFRYNTQIGFNNFYDDLFTRLLVKGATNDVNYFGIKINDSASTTNFSVRNDGLVNTSNALIKNRSINLLGVESFYPGEIYALSVFADTFVGKDLRLWNSSFGSIHRAANTYGIDITTGGGEYLNITEGLLQLSGVPTTTSTPLLVSSGLLGIDNTGKIFKLTGTTIGDSYITGFTYNNSNEFTISDSTGGTFSATLNITTGLTVNGVLISNTITATIISATTYLNLPTDVTITGGTYSDGTAVFTNNTGGTFSVSGFSGFSKFSYTNFSDGTSSVGNSNTLSKSVLIPAGTLTNGALNIKGRSVKSGSNSFGWLNIYVNTSNSLSGAILLGQINSAGNNTLANFSLDRTIPIKSGSFTAFIINSTIGYEQVITNSVSTVTIDWTQNQYIILAVQSNTGIDTLTANFLSVNQF